MNYLYLIHLDTPICHAKHYAGCTAALLPRLATHARGHGARLLQVALERGITWRVARLWYGNFSAESALKAQKHGPDYCPLCNPHAARFFPDGVDIDLSNLIEASIPLTSDKLTVVERFQKG